MVDATVRNFQRKRIEGEVYPGMVPSPIEGETVQGIILEGLADQDLVRLQPAAPFHKKITQNHALMLTYAGPNHNVK